MSKERAYIAIDLKSFYASVECAARRLDPLRTNLVVADSSRTDKTICLAVSPSLKALGISGRARLFEVVARVREINAMRASLIPGGRFTGESSDADELAAHPDWKLTYITAPPRMAAYIKVSTDIYQIYLRHIAPEDIHVYSIDEVFIDATGYLKTYKMTAHELAMHLIREVLHETGITATAGIGSNLYLCKIAMDIVAKHKEADADGVRIAELDEYSFRRELWNHRPLCDFWRIGRRTEKKLASRGIYTMGDIARCSLGSPSDFYNEDLLYRMFGVNAELLIDHAWGWEPCTIDQIHSYRPKSSSLGSGQVLTRPYQYDEARIVLQEMTESLVLDLVDSHLTADQIVLTVGYDIENLQHSIKGKDYRGPVVVDGYGRRVPRHAHGTASFHEQTSSGERIIPETLALFDRIVDPDLTIRRLTITAGHTQPESLTEEERKQQESQPQQLSMFDLAGGSGSSLLSPSGTKTTRKEKTISHTPQQEKQLQNAVLNIQKKYGKNAVLKGISYQDGATQRERNGQIGGHKAGSEKSIPLHPKTRQKNNG